MQQTKLDFGVQELQGRRTLGFFAGNDGGADDLDSRFSGSVTRCKISVHFQDGCIQGNVTIFLVHIVCARATIVSKPETEGLNCVRVLLKDLVNFSNFTICAFDFLQL